MNFAPQTKAWILLFTLVLSTGGTITITTFLGGANIWISILAGLVAGGTNVYHALSAKPSEAETKTNTTP
jgi:hypothetical protein